MDFGHCRHQIRTTMDTTLATAVIITGASGPGFTGYYIEALLRNGIQRERIAPILVPILDHIREAGVGYISEIFDGNEPYTSRGCIAQAWSVAEIARAYRLLY